MTDGETKLFEPDNDGPHCRLTAESYDDSPYAYLNYKQGNSGGLANAGVATIHPAIEPDLTGSFATDGPVVDWSYTEYKAAGDRVRVDHRLVADVEDSAVVVRHETAREQVLGFGDREEYDWREVERWRVTPDGVDHREALNDE